MKCDICKTNEAVLYIEDVHNDKVTHRKICMDCLMNMTQQQLPALMPLAPLLANMIFPGMSFSLDKKEFRCPQCSRSLDEIEKTHTVGCKTCYETFKDFINPIIFPSGYMMPYKGSYPRSLQKISDHRKRISLLKSQLRDAVNTEDFENAAKVRDELKREQEKYKKI